MLTCAQWPTFNCVTLLRNSKSSLPGPPPLVAPARQEARRLQSQRRVWCRHRLLMFTAVGEICATCRLVGVAGVEWLDEFLACER